MIKGILNIFIERKDDFITYFLQHLYLISIALTFILSIGLILGVVMTYHKKIATLILTVTGFLYTIPSIAMFGFLIYITGIGNRSAIIAIIIYGMLPMIRNTYVGLKEVDPNVIEAATGMGSTEMQLLFRVKFPLAFPVIMAGFRTTVVMTVALGGIAAFIGGGGLGIPIWRGISSANQELIFAGSLLVALLAITLDLMLQLFDMFIKRKLYGRGGQK